MSSLVHKTSATQALLAAALGGFLSAAAACGGMASPNSTDSSSQVSSNDVGVGDSAVTPTNPHTPIPATKCASGQVPNPAVTSTVVGAVTQDMFAAQCAAQNGIFEIQPLCSGSNSCRGMSYDSGTQTLTEHSCQATNTCAGFSCVVCG
jgi:hypothetical protein